MENRSNDLLIKDKFQTLHIFWFVLNSRWKLKKLSTPLVFRWKTLMNKRTGHVIYTNLSFPMENFSCMFNENWTVSHTCFISTLHNELSDGKIQILSHKFSDGKHKASTTHCMLVSFRWKLIFLNLLQFSFPMENFILCFVPVTTFL